MKEAPVWLMAAWTNCPLSTSNETMSMRVSVSQALWSALYNLWSMAMVAARQKTAGQTENCTGGRPEDLNQIGDG